MQFEVSIDVDTAGKALEEYLRNDPRFQPVRVGTSAEYAGYVEFGSRGAKKSSSGAGTYKSRGEISPVEKDIREWVERKLGLQGAERDRTANKIYHNLMQFGMPPNPFLRPAMHNVLNAAENDESFWDGKEVSMMEIAEEIAEEMRRILLEKNIPVTGRLMDEIYTKVLDGSESPNPYLDRIAPSTWESDEADYSGDPTRYREAQERRSRRGSR